MRLLTAPRLARPLACLTAVVMLTYVLWRAVATLNPNALLFSLLLLCAEVQGVANFLLFLLMTWDIDTRFPYLLVSGKRVAIFVPTYNEDLDILETTLIGCRAVTYPHSTYVLDDGRRPAVKRLAKRLGCNYLTRPDNKHAKAGNLNAALARTHEDFIVVLDADTVPQPDFLDKTLGYFVDARVALVQLPQEFYNEDSFQHAGRENWHEQTLFYRVIQPGKNRWNAAFWCGSPSVVRRAALDDVGGVATQTITEDIHTSLRLHARGWKTVYHDEILAFGIAPQTYSAFALQRLRWAQGTMQLLRSRENPLLLPGLTLAQRLNYLGSMRTYFDAFEKLIFFLTPALILATGILPLRVGVAPFLLHWFPYIALGTLANVALGRGYFRYLQVERYNLLKMFTFIHASLTLVWRKPLRFRVAPKRADATVYGQERQQLVPQFLLIGCIAGAAVLAGLNIGWKLTATYGHPDIIVVTLFWAMVDIAVLLLGVHEVLRRRHARQTYRFPVSLDVTLTTPAGMTLTGATQNLSRYGAALQLAGSLKVGGMVTLTLALPDGPLVLRAQVVRAQAGTSDQQDVGVLFVMSALAAQQRLVYHLYVSVPRQTTPGAERVPNIAARAA